MIGDRAGSGAVGAGRDISLELGDPAVEKCPALLAQSLVDNRGKVAQTIDLRHHRAQPSTTADRAAEELAAQNMRFANAFGCQHCTQRAGDGGIGTHVSHEDIGIGLAASDQLTDVREFGRQIAHLERLCRVRGVLALDRADRRRRRLGRNKENCVLPAILRFAEDFDGALECDLTDLRTQVLKSAPPDRVERKIGPGADRGPAAGRIRTGCNCGHHLPRGHSIGDLDRHRFQGMPDGPATTLLWRGRATRDWACYPTAEVALRWDRAGTFRCAERPL